ASRANRGFLQRAVHRLAAQWNVRQFLDIGAGLPTQRHTHEVAAEVDPDARVVYVDNDPRVIDRGTKLLADVPNTAVLLGDLREPDAILNHPETRRLLDLSRPVGLLLVAVLQFIPEDDDPYGLVARYMAALPSG